MKYTQEQLDKLIDACNETAETIHKNFPEMDSVVEMSEHIEDLVILHRAEIELRGRAMARELIATGAIHTEGLKVRPGRFRFNTAVMNKWLDFGPFRDNVVVQKGECWKHFYNFATNILADAFCQAILQHGQVKNCDGTWDTVNLWEIT